MGLPGEDEVVEPESVVLGDALFDLAGQFSPGEVDLRVTSGNLLCSRRRPAEEDLRDRPRGPERRGPGDLVVLTEGIERPVFLRPTEHDEAHGPVNDCATGVSRAGTAGRGPGRSARAPGPAARRGTARDVPGRRPGDRPRALRPTTTGGCRPPAPPRCGPGW